MKAYEYVDVSLESSELSCENIQVFRLTGREAISELFWFDIEIVSLKQVIDLDAALGAQASIVFSKNDGDSRSEIRRVHGMIVEITDMLDTETTFATYRLRMAPRAHRLTLVETQEIFMDLSVPEIIQKKLELVGLDQDMELRLMGAYPKREFVVQYKETDLAFISRLAEHLGISFFFEHDGGTDRIVFTDHKDGFRPVEARSTVTFRPRGEQCEIYKISATRKIIPSSYMLQDYNYRTPTVDLTARYELPSAYAGGVVEYGAHYKTPEEGAALAQVRAEERRSGESVYAGESDQCQLGAGGKFKLEDHPRIDISELLLVEVAHRVEQVVMTEGATGTGPSYTNEFRAIDASLTFRPPRRTPKPRIHGAVTALVEPMSGGEIGEFAQLDDDGRYTVKFYFDTGEKEGAFSSRPVRMIQLHAGPYYGAHMPLKPGIEVLIVFMDGDPDRPLLLGSVPNPITPSPVTRVNATMARFKTVSGILVEMKDRG